MHRDPGGEYALAHPVFQERGAARDRRTIDRPGEMAQQATRDTGVINDRQFGGDRSRWVEPGDGALSGAAANRDRIVEVGEMDGRMIVVVALHRRSGARQRGGRYRVAGSRRSAGKARRGDQERLAPAEAGLGAFRIGDARHGERRLLGRGGARHQLFGGRFGRVHHIECDRLGRRGGVGEAGIGVLGHHPRHRHGVLGQLLEAGGIHRAGRDHGGPLAQEHPQPRSRPSERSTCSVAPSRRCTESDVPEISTASAASAPAARARAIRSARRSRGSGHGAFPRFQQRSYDPDQW